MFYAVSLLKYIFYCNKWSMGETMCASSVWIVKSQLARLYTGISRDQANRIWYRLNLGNHRFQHIRTIYEYLFEYYEN